MYLYLVLLLAVVSCGKAPFIEPNQVHQAFSELEVNLILNENKNAVILMGVGRYQEDKEKESLESLLERVYEREPYAGFALSVDCDKFEDNLEGKMNLCKKSTTGVRLLLFKPNPITLSFFGHDILGTQDVIDVTDNTEPNVVAKRVREAIPNFVKQIEDEYDLEEFLRDTTMTKVIYFEEELLNPSYLQKLSARYLWRADVGICDNKNIAAAFNAKFPSIVLLDYNSQTYEREVRVFNGSTDFEDRPFDALCEFVEPHVLPNRSRDILLDFELIQPLVLNISTSKKLQKLLSQDKMVMLEASHELKCDSLAKMAEKYSTMFNYVCMNSTEAQFADISPGKVLIFQQNTTERLVLQPSQQIEQVLKFPQIKQMISTEKEADMCTEMAATKDKITIMAYYPLKSYNAFLVRYLNSLPAFNAVFQFCQVYNPDGFVQKQYSLKENTLSVLIPQKGGQSSQKVENSGIESFGDIKLYLREIAVNKLLGLFDEALKHRIKYITTAEDLTKYCFSKPCVLAMINLKKATRAQQEIKMVSDMARDFEKQFNIVWLDGHCHKQVLNQFKIKPEQLSALAYFRQKTNEYSLFAGKYWIQRQVKKWLKSLRVQPKIKRLKYSMDMESRVCQSNDEL